MSVTVNKTRLPGSVIQTASGAVASVSDARMRGAIGVEASFSPKQDLHGYANPWVGGAGKNLLKNLQSTQTISGVTFTVNEDGSVNVNGTASALVVFSLNDMLDEYLSEGVAYILNGSPTNSDTSKWKFRVYNGTSDYIDTGNGVGFTFTKLSTAKKCDIVVYSGTTVNNILIKPMIRLATVSNASFEPYENLCPISGITSASAWADPQYAGLVDWNQRISNGDFPNATGWAGNANNYYYMSASDGILHAEAGPSSVGNISSYIRKTNAPASTETHKYFAGFSIRHPRNAQIRFLYAGAAYNVKTYTVSANTWIDLAWIVEARTNSSAYYFYTNVNKVQQEGDVIDVKNATFFDLTQMFGETRADEIYALEVATPGAGVAYFKSLFPKDYYAYDLGGTLKTVSAVNGDPHTLTVQLGEERYGGSYDFVRGKLVMTMRMVDLGTLTWTRMKNPNTLISNTFLFMAAPAGSASPLYPKVQFNGITSAYKWVTNYSSFNADSCAGYIYNTNIAIRDDRYTDAATFKTAVSGAQLCYELATPIVIDMTPAEFELFHKNNFVWSDVGDTTLTYAAIHEHGG